MTTQIFSQRMHNNVGAILKRAAQIRAWDGVVDDQRQTVGMGHLGQRGNIGDVAQWIANRLAINGFGTRINMLRKRFRLAGIGKAYR